eukprot:TRINITY_DN1078_c1_g1_i1.p1 TRINITY_DN1078_c1_g1~~TRINITY_DN1078_c1_g1_i1.p1  ORF type:complete len:827 (+),score=325.35 TRINITY_DN1078_c1_g1_i1:108-2483(+)
MAVQLTDEQQIIKQYCHDFFEIDAGRADRRKYTELIEKAKKRPPPWRLIINLQDLHQVLREATNDPGTRGRDLYERVQDSPQEYVRFFEMALQEILERQQEGYKDAAAPTGAMSVGFEGYFGAYDLTPRGLNAAHLNHLVMVEGLVKSANAFTYKAKASVHWNEAMDTFVDRSYRDQLSTDIDDNNLPTVNVMPKRDAQGNALRTEYGLCSFEDMQGVTLQERPERAPIGQMPVSVDVRLGMDLVDSCKPGDRVRIVGIYMPYTDDNKEFSTIIIANNVIHIEKAPTEEDITEKDENRIKAAARKPEIFETLSRSIAPSIFGHDEVKKAILLMLLGGVERNIGGHHIRGDIHLLLVGEPATAKSQLLRFVLKLAPLAMSTTGKGSSGVGLTGAVVTDPETGDKTLAAGAMVLADRGVLCIDEFDKMDDKDRVAMHEAMEQGSVTIAKAGLHTSLNARCSCLAAANPTLGFYAVKQSVGWNVGLPDSLLSRFDLLFIILDNKTSEHTRMIADHVLSNHRKGKGVTVDQERDAEDHGIREETKDMEMITYSAWFGEAHRTLFTIEFLRKYIQYAKTKSPTITDEAQEKMSDIWKQMRAEQRERLEKHDYSSAIYISPRTLESLVRLSTAHAKCRLSPLVEPQDVDAAVELMEATINARQLATDVRKKEKADWDESSKQAPRGKDAQGEAGAEEGGAKRQRAEPAAAGADGGTVAPMLASIIADLHRDGMEAYPTASLREDLNQKLGRGSEDEISTSEFMAILQSPEFRSLLAQQDEGWTGGFTIEGPDIMLDL